MEQGIEASAAQLPLQHGRAALDIFITVAAFIPMANAIAGRGRGHEIEPIKAGMGGLCRNHLNEIAILQRRGQGAKAIIDTHPLAVITNFRVDAVGKIYGR